MLRRGEIVVDSFAGGGGASLGIAQALGFGPALAINHDADAITMHAANHPDTRHMTEDVWGVDPRRAVKGRKVGLLWASPDCRHFSRAKGGKPVEKKIRSLAWVVIKWAAEVAPRVIILENVREFAEWGPIVPAWKCGACQWRGTEGQATLVRKRRCCPRCNSVRLKTSDEMIPDPAQKGLTFRRWAGRLKALGYEVEYKNLNAADYGAPTHRRRLFLIARNDGEPITWPDSTHGDPKKVEGPSLFGNLKPWRTAAECIDWSLPCPSIFDRKRPLAEATLRRIALGFKRYVLENPRPFVVGCAHGEFSERNGGRVNSLEEPLGTINAGGNDRAIVTPYLAPVTNSGFGANRSNDVNAPLPTITTAKGGEWTVVAPTLIQMGYGERKGQAPRTSDLQQPLGAVTSGGIKAALVTAFLAKHFGGVVGHELERPIGTVTATDHHSLVTAWLAKHYGDGHIGVPIETPFPTITAVPNQNQIVAANLVRMSYGEKSWNGVDEPLPTITSQGNKFGLIYSFLVRYFGTAIGQYLTEPLFTVTGKDRFGLVVVQVEGEPYVVADIGMRMLSPRELARAQGFPDTYLLTGTKTSQVAKIGNSVSPVMAKALVTANFCTEFALAGN